jgi:peptide/nickel transport system permease protein
VIIETIFNYPGLAQLMVDGVANRDMPLIQACAMMFCSAYLLLLIIADVLGVITNPKLRSL